MYSFLDLAEILYKQNYFEQLKVSIVSKYIYIYFFRIYRYLELFIIILFILYFSKVEKLTFATDILRCFLCPNSF